MQGQPSEARYSTEHEDGASKGIESRVVIVAEAHVRRIVVVREVSSSYRARACGAAIVQRGRGTRGVAPGLDIRPKGAGWVHGRRRRGERAQRAVSGGLGFSSGEIGLDDECDERSAMAMSVAQKRSGQQRSMRTWTLMGAARLGESRQKSITVRAEGGHMEHEPMDERGVTPNMKVLISSNIGRPFDENPGAGSPFFNLCAQRRKGTVGSRNECGGDQCAARSWHGGGKEHEINAYDLSKKIRSRK
ncbi:hypothetical protein B0H14DRAFT_2579199 [Mycena olivaceomarginata]|nr:hypothetical protein B0H14DRAFT_2579199 [Mycena olivaceomarginata]